MFSAYAAFAFQGRVSRRDATMATARHTSTLHNQADDRMFGLGYAGDADAFGPQSSYYETGQAARMFAPAAPTQILYLTEPGTASPVSIFDINQGQIGDCFLLSPIGEEALFHQSAIMSMIHNNGNGTETVTLYTDRNGHLPTFATTGFKATTVTVTNSFSAQSVNNGATQDMVGNQKEIWPQVIEKAVATLAGGYGAIANGGYPVLAMEVLTGQIATYVSPGALTFAALQKFVAAGDLITMDTSSARGLGYGLVSNHCYMFDKIVGSGASAAVQLLNPWGIDQPAAIPLTHLAQSGIVEVDIGRTG
jgi:hypothetical protein